MKKRSRGVAKDYFKYAGSKTVKEIMCAIKFIVADKTIRCYNSAIVFPIH